MFVFVFFFFKQKTAYEMRISDWSSDVCSSDLAGPHHHFVRAGDAVAATALRRIPADVQQDGNAGRRKRARQGGQPMTPIELGAIIIGEIGRASCRERVCQYV